MSGSRWFRGWGEPVTDAEREAIGLGLSVFAEFVAIARDEHPEAVAEREARLLGWNRMLAEQMCREMSAAFDGVFEAIVKEAERTPADPC